jgi:ubiquinone/menaquinone biosynthesis C-methylase UbiE
VIEASKSDSRRNLMKHEQTLSNLPARLLVVVTALSLLPSAVGRLTAQESERDRERVERVSDILAALGAREGLHIADVGSNSGFYTVRIARAVGPTGRAYAVDIQRDALDRVRQRVAKERITNLEPILSEVDDPKLPSGAIDAVLIRNAYHEMTSYRSVLAGISRGLKPGGILVIVEPIHEKRRQLSREEQTKEHEIAPELVEADLREAGFDVLEVQERFQEFTQPPPGGYFLIRARRP